MNFCAIAMFFVPMRISVCGSRRGALRGFCRGIRSRSLSRDRMKIRPWTLSWNRPFPKRGEAEARPKEPDAGNEINMLGVNYLTITGGRARTTQATIENPTEVTGDAHIVANFGVFGTVSVTGTNYMITLHLGDTLTFPASSEYDADTGTVKILEKEAIIFGVGRIDVIGGTIVDSVAMNIRGPVASLIGAVVGRSTSNAASTTFIDGDASMIVMSIPRSN